MSDQRDTFLKPSQKKQKINQTIVLVGLMGAGKSSVGWRLARRLGLPFFDSDKEIEKAAGCSIPDIYERWGEKAFKKAEYKVITRLLSGPVHVLSTGDGSFVEPELRALILKQTISIWLKADLDTLHQRVKHRHTRPQLFEGDSRDILAELVEERYPIYSQADLWVHSQDEAHEQTVDRLMEVLNPYLKDQ